MKKISLLVLGLISAVSFAQQPALIKLNEEKLHARVREWPYPVNGVVVPTNAPALLWPATNGTSIVLPMESGSEVPEDPNIGNVRYQVMLARDSTFTQNVIKSGLQAWAVFPLHQALTAGNWYWKYGYAIKDTNVWTWSSVYHFVIDERHAKQAVSPAVESVLKRNEGPHPRLWDMYRNGDLFYRNNKDNPEAKQFVASAEKLMAVPLPTEKPLLVLDTNGKTPLEKKILVERMYHGFGDLVGEPVENLCIAYQLTDDKRFLADAKKRALNLLRMNPDGLATSDDFTSGAILEALGWFYDAGYKTLTDAERKEFITMIRLRGKRVYDHLPNRFELHVSDNHVWQITLRNLAIATVAVVNEVPEAKEWLTYMYEVWSARFPVLGTTDGGWHEGNGYFKVNYKSIIYLSQMFGDFTGVDYFKLPWMQNLPYYLLYTYPPASATTAYGDMWENSPKMVRAQGLFAEALSFKNDDPYLAWYVEQIKKDNPDFFTRPIDEYSFFRFLNYSPSAGTKVISPSKLPKLRTFADVGVAAMHSDLANTSHDLSLYLMSNPFGSSGHGSASQNAITLNYKGKTLFGGSGYYGNFSDKHNLLYYRTSRAYSTILVDSLSQKIGEEGYGWLPRSLNGQHLQYALGDASNAYGDIKSSFWLDRFSQLNLNPKTTGVYGDHGVSLYRRHALQLEGGYVVLYDELEAKQPVKWTTQFHAPYYTIVADKTDNNNQQQFTMDIEVGQVQTNVFSNAPTRLVIHNQFAEKAENWAKVKDVDGKVKDFKLQWHAGITSQPANTFRFLTVIQIKDGKLEMVKTQKLDNGYFEAVFGGWEVVAELNGAKKPALLVKNEALKSGFGYGLPDIQIAGKSFVGKIMGSSILVEENKGKLTLQETTDTLPDVALYDKP